MQLWSKKMLIELLIKIWRKWIELTTKPPSKKRLIWFSGVQNGWFKVWNKNQSTKWIIMKIKNNLCCRPAVWSWRFCTILCLFSRCNFQKRSSGWKIKTCFDSFIWEFLFLTPSYIKCVFFSTIQAPLNKKEFEWETMRLNILCVKGGKPCQIPMHISTETKDFTSSYFKILVRGLPDWAEKTFKEWQLRKKPRHF